MNTDHATIELDHDEEIKQRFVFEGKQKTTLLAFIVLGIVCCLLYTSPSPRDKRQSRMPSSA